MSEINTLKKEIEELKKKNLLLEAEKYHREKAFCDLKKQDDRLISFFEKLEMIFMIRTKEKYILISGFYEKIFLKSRELVKTKMSEHYSNIVSADYDTIKVWNSENVVISKELCFNIADEKKWFLCKSFPVTGNSGKVMRRVEVYYDITDVKILTEQRNTFYKLLPICSSCKRIRDPQGEWHDVEVFIKEKTGSDLTHSLCPECTKKLYGKYLSE